MGNEVMEAPKKAEKVTTQSSIEQELGDHIVTLKQVVSAQQSSWTLPKSIKDDNTKRIGSSWKRGTRDVVRGLDEEEERRYLPKIIGVPPTSESWDAKVLDYWRNFGIIVPKGAGVPLNVGMKKGTYFKLNEKGMRVEEKGVVPISLEDYICYNICKQHKDVATSEADLLNKDFFKYYITDHKVEKKEEGEKYQERKKATRIFQKLIEPIDTNGTINEEKIDWVLEICKRNSKSQFHNKSYKAFTTEEKEIALENEVKMNPEVFIKVVTDPNLEDKAFVGKLLEVGILERHGNSYVQDNEVVGGSLKELLAYMKNNNNSQTIVQWRERLKATKI